MQVVIFHRFNRVFSPDDKHRNSKLSSPKWWEQRLEVYKKTAYRSLMAQTDQDFHIWAIFNQAQLETYTHIKKYVAAIEKLDKVSVKIDKHNRTTEYEPISHIEGETMLFNLDSDDHLHKNTVKTLKQYRNCYMADGYVYDLNTGRLHEYHANGAWPPFWGLYFPEGVKPYAYMRKHGLNGHHYQKKGDRLPDGMYLYSIHGDNTTNSWDNKNTTKHVGKEADKKILKDFGYE